MGHAKLTIEQRAQVLEWLAAGYESDSINAWCTERAWPVLTKQAISYYRKRYTGEIAGLTGERHADAMQAGLALKAERLARLKRHADSMERIKDERSATGRMHNAKEWRETLDDIARELGHRRQGLDVSLLQELEAFLDRAKESFDADTYARIVALASGDRPD